MLLGSRNTALPRLLICLLAEETPLHMLTPEDRPWGRLLSSSDRLLQTENEPRGRGVKQPFEQLTSQFEIYQQGELC